MKQFLVVEDNYDIANLVSMHLKDLGAEVQLASDGNVGLSLAQKKRFDLIILDLMLPGIDGLEICRRLRGTDNDTPILMLTAKSAELDRVVGLEMGADDYLPKPFSVRELVARAKAILRRAEMRHTSSASTVAESLRAGDLFPLVIKQSISPRANLICCGISPPTLDRSLPAASCWTACGATVTTVMSTPSTHTSTGYVQRSKQIPPLPFTF